jgi:subtilase family serine protease
LRTAASGALRNRLAQESGRLGLNEGDLSALTLTRDHVTRSNGLRHVTFAQSLDGIPVYEASVTAHIAPNGDVVRVTSSAGRGAGRLQRALISAEDATTAAIRDVDSPRGPSVEPTPVWFPMDGGVRLAWHVVLAIDTHTEFYDVVVDARSGEVLLRRNRVIDAIGSGRVIQSNATAALDPRLPDPTPIGSDACPPPANHELRDLTGPFRDPSTVLGGSGHLDGNNARVFRGNTSNERALGTYDGTGWTFDFPFNSAGSAETALFFALNFAHDFFYDLGFDEAAGNFQTTNFGRGGLGGDPIVALARAAGRNNATYLHAPEGASAVISMFLWDGTGCWAEDVDGDTVPDLDGDYDTDIVLHEFHHGVSHRLNTSFTGNEARAIGEGGSDFFAYTVNNDTVLAEYARPGGLRRINDKAYNSWSCDLLSCGPHANGEIWANVLWDIRERFRMELVRGSESAAINETNQLYVDGLKLSPPTPTMLDMRDAMLEADAARNPGSPDSVNFCRLWEAFAGRGMGLNATDTRDNGYNQVGANFEVPTGCTPPPAPPAVNIEVIVATATEAGPVPGSFRISREQMGTAPTSVKITVSGTASKDIDYVALPATVTIPTGELWTDVPVLPIDDSAVEGNETVIITVKSGGGYVLGTSTVATMTIVSEDVAPDLGVSSLTIASPGGPGLPLEFFETTRNQGTGPSAASTTFYYLSHNWLLDADDVQLGLRAVPSLSAGATDSTTASITIPSNTVTGNYYVIAKADGPGALSEISESNNIRYALARIGPDLEIAALTVPSAAGAGTMIQVTDTTTNDGGGPAAASTTRFYLSANLSLDATDIPLQARNAPGLAAGASSTASTFVSIPTTAPTGTQYIVAIADDGNAIGEPIETNNTRWASIKIGADLSIPALTVPTGAASSGSIAVTDTTRNTGGGAAGPSATGFYLSSNISFDSSDLPLGSRPVPALALGESHLATTTLTLPHVVPGSYYVLARADDSGEIPETLETNNVRSDSILIGPDLQVSSLIAPSTISAGATVTVTDTVKSFGAPAGPSTTRFFLSINASFDASDIPLEGSRSVPALAADATHAGATTVTIPAGLSGKYYVLAICDALGAVGEANESNNVRIRLVTINP